ncbi:MAG: right-handed parallel beta-helix repeat-containing protein [Chitinispirillales bacterium]|jgi:parallel beta-helix repeat protein|nr:right-handed parallel beta-helix repeat-containing protein [Chitinispirillales bacterium]
MKNKTIIALMLTIAALAAFAFGEQRVSGIIDRETRWKAEDGPFIVEGDILITRWGSLTIFPGTRVIIASDAKKTHLTTPFDKADSTLVSIRVLGNFNCVGRRNNPIVFEPERSELANFAWRGIIIDEVDSRHTEIAFTEISGATTGVTIKNTNIFVRNSAMENNNIGILSINGGAPRIYNNLLTSNFTAAIKVERANPRISNNIIAFNKNIGLWCDNSSKIAFKHNCVFGNPDGDFLDCEPDIGRMTRRGVRGRDSTDAHGNIVADPIFAGSAAEARAIELDIELQTDPANVRDRRLLNIPNLQFGAPRPRGDPTLIGADGRTLSAYSPCINAGESGGAFRNVDGSRNTMGPAGGPDFWDR